MDDRKNKNDNTKITRCRSFLPLPAFTQQLCGLEKKKNLQDLSVLERERCSQRGKSASIQLWDINVMRQCGSVVGCLINTLTWRIFDVDERN